MILEPNQYNHLINIEKYDTKNTPQFHVFLDIDEILNQDADLFINLKKQIQPKVKHSNGISFIDDIDYSTCIHMVDHTPLGKNSAIMFEILYDHMLFGRKVDIGAISYKSSLELCNFAVFWGEISRNRVQVNAQKNRDFITAINVLKESFLSRPFKEFYILQKWLLDWSKYLLREKAFNPSPLPHYKQGDVIRVDFGWRIGREFGGIHFAIVIEKNNNPTNPMIFLVPMSSYIPGEKIHFNNIDLGKCVGDKYSFAVLTQTGSYSKMRIVDKRIHARLSKDLLNEILKKLSARLGMEQLSK